MPKFCMGHSSSILATLRKFVGGLMAVDFDLELYSLDRKLDSRIIGRDPVLGEFRFD